MPNWLSIVKTKAVRPKTISALASSLKTSTDCQDSLVSSEAYKVRVLNLDIAPIAKLNKIFLPVMLANVLAGRHSSLNA